VGPDLAYIEVAVALPVFNTFTYSISADLSLFASSGKRAIVPFGRRSVTGYILGPIKRDTEKTIKPVIEILDETPLFPDSIIPLYRWISDYYMHPIGEVIKGALPGGLTFFELTTVTATKKGTAAFDASLCSVEEAKILDRVKNGPCRLDYLCKKSGIDTAASLIRTMERRDWLFRNRELAGGSTKERMDKFVSLSKSGISRERISAQRKKIIDTLISRGELPIRELKTLASTTASLINRMTADDLVKIVERRVYRDPFGEPIEPDTIPEHTKEQQNVISTVVASLGKGFQAYLLTGITGSGKTEVYMQVASEAIGLGFSALVLVPEIALISQMEKRFRARFGDCIGVLHSGLSPGERYDQWNKITGNKVKIVIGARSAIFAPFENTGIIIVDEEHDPSYKQDSGLRYNARDLAAVRAKLSECLVLFGSATPSVQSYYNVFKEKFLEVTLRKRIEKRPLPEVSVIDLSKTRDLKGIDRYFSTELREAVAETLAAGKQTLLFLNRRGFASFPVCSACGEPIRCKNCDISLTLHQKANAYKCHYCGHSKPSSTHCPNCGSEKIMHMGLGTEKVEAAVKALYPEARIARMDRDTTRRKGSILKILKGLRDRSIDILIGTQMIAKGHDFPDITLVGIICADLSLAFPDFRAGERTFQLLAQVSGRAGRGDMPGRVILQTYAPDHFSILAAKEQDFRAFYHQEIVFRKALNYPPFSRMIQIRISGKDRDRTRDTAEMMGDRCVLLLKGDRSLTKDIELLGPIESPIQRIANRYRWQILLKGSRIKILHSIVRRLLFEEGLKTDRNVKTVVDVDPLFMM